MAAWATIIVTLITLYPKPAVAADKWWLRPEVQRRLGLTHTQVVALNDVFETNLGERVHLRKELDRLEADLAKAIKAGNEAHAIRLIDHVGAARMARNTARTMMLVHMYRILTPKQRRRVDSRTFLER